MPEYIKGERWVHHVRRSRKVSLRGRRYREDQAAKRQALLDELPVEVLIAHGHYNRSPRPLPHGIDIWERECQGEYESIKVPTLAACFPLDQSPSRQLAKLNPMHWEGGTYYWAFKQTDWSVVNWCCFDLLDRLLDLPDWKPADQIPLRWAFRPWDKRDRLWLMIERINAGQWTGQYYKPHPLPGLSLNANRHERTPYDYEWQTGRKDRNEAQAYWNEVIKRILSRAE